MTDVSRPQTTLDEPHAGVRPRYQMTRVRAGDYLLPSNDGGALWRVSRYLEDGSLERQDGSKVVGDFWRAARFDGSLDDADRLLAREPEEFLSFDRWIEGACLLPTRAAAVREALEGEQLRHARQLLKDVVSLYTARTAGSDKHGNGEHYDAAWWRGTCDSVVATAEEEGLLERYGAAGVLWGGFDDGDGQSSGHCWIDLDGIIVDPTVRQFGGRYPARGWALPRNDPRRGHYTYPERQAP